MQEMSIVRALSELKLLDSKICKQIKDSAFCASRVRNKKIDGVMSDEVFTSKAKSNLDSINDLINRRSKIKSLIVASNAITNVKINNETMTVADAIERKNSIEYDKLLLKTLKKQYAKELEEIEYANDSTSSSLQSLLINKFGVDRDKSNSSKPEKEIEAITKAFNDNNEHILIDPLNINNLIEKLEEKINGFESEVDYILTESNTLTKIQI